MKLYRFVFLIIILLSSSCSSVKLAVDNSDFNILRLNLQFYPSINKDVKVALKNELEDFIIKHNNDPKRLFDVAKTEGNQKSTLSIYLLKNQLVSEGQQVAGILVSAAGLSLPIIMAQAGSEFVLFFYYFPKDISIADVQLSKDINGLSNNQPIRYNISNSGFLRSYEEQIIKHSDKFGWFLGKLVTDISNSYKKELSTKSNNSNFGS